MSLMNRLDIVGHCNAIEELVGNQDFNYGYDGIHGKVHFGILGGKYAKAEKDFMAALRKYASSKDKDELAVAVETYLEKIN